MGAGPWTRSYLYVVEERVDEAEAWDALVAADHAHVLGVFAVGHADAVGGAER